MPTQVSAVVTLRASTFRRCSWKGRSAAARPRRAMSLPRKNAAARVNEIATMASGLRDWSWLPT
ncbi:hypothetical protein [Amycolatopsis sp. H20-H5]|uniref:hypothetical protein n=1 Tax=Amycolatopsis sp. H20-H5 TaxID=3046309 RepID=UPI002DBB6E55|nr:hypothetical protein [Amycolatopsis sp. H20-H5]MEC3976012.1 hypothetical protein [Amycolatopsis sp. H20-H5]